MAAARQPPHYRLAADDGMIRVQERELELTDRGRVDSPASVILRN